MVAYSKGMPVGTQAPAFALPGVDGKSYSLDSFRDKPVLVVIFTCNHCPYAQALEQRFIELQHDYGARGVQLVAISSNDASSYPADAFPQMQTHAQTRGWTFPYLYDESQAVARAYDAACTPDIFVFDAQRKLRYNGRCDDNWKEPANVQKRELRQALDLVLAGKPVDFEVAPALGCSIKWKAA